MPPDKPNHNSTVMRTVWTIQNLSGGVHRFVYIQETGTVDIDGMNHELNEARKIWNDFIKEGYRLIKTEQVEKPKYTSTINNHCKVWDMKEFHDMYREIEEKSKYDKFSPYTYENYALKA